MDLLYFIKVLYRNIWIIIGLSFLAMITAYALLLNKTALYTSTAQYSTGFTSEKVKFVDGTASLDFYTIELKFDNVIETIKSPEVLSRISYSLLLHDLTNTSSPYTTLTEKDKQKPIYKIVNTDSTIVLLTHKLARKELLRPSIDTEEDILNYLKLYKYDYISLLENLSVNRVANTDYLDIAYTSMNPELSATVVNSIGVVFLNYYKSLNQRRTDENASNIKDLLHSQQSKVDSLGQLLLNEKISQGSIDPVSRTTNAMATVTELESKLAEEKGRYNVHFNRYNSLKARLAELQPNTASTDGNETLVKLTNRRNDLIEELNRKGGKDPVLEKQISDLRIEINNITNSVSGKTKTKDAIDDINSKISEESSLLNASKSTIDEYEQSIKRYMNMTNTNPGSAIKMGAIQTQLDMENRQLSNLKEIANQIAGLAKDDPTSNFIQTRVGQASVEPNSKKTLIKMALSGISVFFLSSVFFIFLEIFDSSVKTPSIFNKLTKAKIVSVLNKVNLKRRNAADIIREDDSEKKYIKYEIFKNNIRKLRFELINSDNKVFLFTSAQRKTGKSTIIQALATSLTFSKKRVLILDMNFYNNTLTRFFNTGVTIQDVIGKNNFSQISDQEELADTTQTEGLFIIGCVEGNSTPSELFLNEEMQSFFVFARKRYDFILVEGASLNDFADSKELARYVDGIFSVYSADNSLLQADKISTKFITDLKEKNYGVILNKVLTENINS